MSETLSFEIDKIEFIEEINNSQFARVKLWCFASGENLHGMPVSEETLQLRAETIYDKPLVWCYNSFTDDAMGHEKQEVPCGFVQRQDNPIVFERCDDGRLFTVVEALIWTNYSGKLIEIFEKTDGNKAVSVEIAVLETKENEEKQTEITDFCYMAITILGEEHNPAIPLANAQILEFAEAKKQVEEMLFSESKSDISTEIVEEFSQKEDEKMTFNKEEFAQTFSMTANDMRDMLRDACEAVKYNQGEYEYCKYWLCDYDENYVYCYNEEEGGKVAIPYSITEGSVTCDFENVKNAKTVTQWVLTEEKEDDDEVFSAMMKKMGQKFADDANQEAKAQEELNKKEAEDNKKLADEDKEDKVEMSDMENQMKEMKTKMETMSAENESLIKFKADIEEKEKMAKVECVMSEVEELPQDKKEEFRAKVAEFATVDAWANYVKSEAFDMIKETIKKDGVKSFALPFAPDDKKSKSLWAE